MLARSGSFCSLVSRYAASAHIHVHRVVAAAGCLRFLVAHRGCGLFVAMALLAGSLVFLVGQGNRSWVVGAIGTVLVLALVFVAMVYFVHLRNTLGKFRAMGAPSATVEVGESSLAMSSGLGSASIGWSAVTELWQFESFWLLLFSKAQFVTLPLASIPVETQLFIVSRVKAAGAKVVG